MHASIRLRSLRNEEGVVRVRRPERKAVTPKRSMKIRENSHMIEACMSRGRRDLRDASFCQDIFWNDRYCEL